MREYQEIRRDYGKRTLMEENLPEHPYDLMQSWLQQAVQAECMDPTAFVLATSDGQEPDARVVLLKQYDKRGLVFFTHYNSHKGQQIESNPIGVACFYWPELSRQIRVKGQIEKVSKAESEEYFNTRPEMSQVAAIVSPQSEIIPSRQWLDERFNQAVSRPKECPAAWGGYLIKPTSYEFFQGRDNRLHDRFRVLPNELNAWIWQRLAP